MLKISLFAKLVFIEERQIVHLTLCVLGLPHQHFLVLLISYIDAVVKIASEDYVAADLFLYYVLKDVLDRHIACHALFLPRR